MSVLNDETRYQLLKLLEQNPHVTQRELAAAMGISLGKANFCLKALIEKGWIKADNFRRSKNKNNYVYLVTAGGIKEKARVTVRFLKRKQKEYDALVKELEYLRKEAALLDRVEEGE